MTSRNHDLFLDQMPKKRCAVIDVSIDNEEKPPGHRPLEGKASSGSAALILRGSSHPASRWYH